MYKIRERRFSDTVVKALQKIALSSFVVLFALSPYSLQGLALFLQKAEAALPAPGAVEENIAVWVSADSGGVDWSDRSGQSTSISKVGSPTLVVNGLNFNPTVKLDPGSRYTISTDIDRNTQNDVHVFSVVKPGDGTTETILSSSASGDHRSLRTSSVTAGTVANFTKPSAETGHIFDAQFHTDVADGSAVYINSLQVGGLADGGGNSTPDVTLGATSAGADACENCEIAETIIYKGELTEQQEQRIRSYLAIKYGLTLDQTTPYSYLGSDGLDAWNQGDNDGFRNDIFGIGRDTETGLHQQISRSVNDPTGPIFSTDTNFTDTNGSHREITTDRTFVVAGHDGDALAFTDSYNESPNTKLARAWRIDKSFVDIGTFYVAIPKSTFDITGKNPVLINAETDSIISTVLEDDTYYYADLSPLGDGNAFTFAQDPPIGPGGVAVDLAFWYKADGGISAPLESETVRAWEDQTENDNDVTNVGTPTYHNSATDWINYNPVIKFDGSTDGFSIPDNAMGAGDDSISFYTVFASEDVGVTQRIVNLGQVGTTPGTSIGVQVDGGLYGVNVAPLAQGRPVGVSNDTPTMGTVYTYEADTDDVQVALGGADFSLETVSQTIRDYGATDNTIGYVTTGPGEFFQGRIAEIMAYNTTHDAEDRKKLESYVAFKYGITLDQAQPTNYIGSDGLDVWNATDNAGYDKDIFGIGRDDLAVYSQQISRSVNDPQGPIFATDTSFTEANGTHREIGANMSFVAAGHNGAAMTFSDTFQGVANTKLARAWKVDRSLAEVGEFYVAIPKTTITFPGPSPVVIDAENGDVIGAMTDDGTHYYAEITSIGDGKTFTFASNAADASGFTVTQSAGSTEVNEDGEDRITVVLNNAPVSDVVITITSSNVEEATALPPSMTFTPSDWDAAQEIVVAGVDDPDNVNETPTVTFAVDAALSDDAYDLLAPQIVQVTVYDNNAPGIFVHESDNETKPHENEEDYFDVTLLEVPTSNVVINVSSLDVSKASVLPQALTFTPANWNTPQRVTVTGVYASELGNTQTGILLSIDGTNSAAEYAGVPDRTVPVTVVDSDGGGAPDYAVNVSVTDFATNPLEEGTDTFRMRLNAQPTSDVVLDITSSNTDIATVSPGRITITPATWNQFQIITVTGIKDANTIDNEIPIFATVVPELSDNNFDNLPQQEILVTVRDIDAPGMTVIESGGLTSAPEGLTDTFTVALAAEPTGDVVYTLTSADAAIATVSPTTVVFGIANWDEPQTVTATGVSDANLVTDTTNITVAIDPAQSADEFDTLTPSVVTVTVPESASVDTDGDGVPDAQEVIDGTSPTDPTDFRDTDGDGHPDFVEDQAGSNPNDPTSVPLDTDRDGVPDLIEARDGTDPNVPTDYIDTDGDGHPDFVENMAGSDGNDPDSHPLDTDGDGVPDVIEAIDGTDPTNPLQYRDTDGDGHPNYIENMANSDGDVTGSVPSDRDNDGVPDVVEEMEGTDPDNGLDYRDGDGDGVPDYYEIHMDSTDHEDGTDYKDSDGGGDSDYGETIRRINEGLPAGNPNDNSDDDIDRDGRPDIEENAGPNGGDANGDGILDSTQKHVATAINPALPGTYITLEIAGGCADIADMGVQSEATQAVQDPTAQYPFGLVSFLLLCDAPGASSDVTVIFSDTYDTSAWTYKKYNGTTGTYSVIDTTANVRYSSRIIGGVQKTLATYTVRDGDSNTDVDGVINSQVLDPSGPSIPQESVEDSAVPVYRFWSDTYKAHFYTKNVFERDVVIAAYDDIIWRYEGVSFYAHASRGTDRVPVYRFWSDLYKSHFYTTTEVEKFIFERDDKWKYEGIDWYAYDEPGQGRNAVYRFWSTDYSAYFYTQNEVERDIVRSNNQNWDQYQGPVYYAPVQ